jgi:hypothetical protein
MARRAWQAVLGLDVPNDRLDHGAVFHFASDRAGPAVCLYGNPDAAIALYNCDRDSSCRHGLPIDRLRIYYEYLIVEPATDTRAGPQTFAEERRSDPPAVHGLQAF